MSLADVTYDAPKRRGRPATAPQDAATYQRLIRAGLVHLTERGYSAVGLDMILTHARVPKGSFYHYFPNKAAFGRAAIAAYRAYFVAKMERHLSDDSLAPLARVAAFPQPLEGAVGDHIRDVQPLVGDRVFPPRLLAANAKHGAVIVPLPR